MALKAAFIFIAPQADPILHRQWVKTPQVELLAVAVADYEAAEKATKDMIEEEGIQAIELCGGFGHLGVARVKAATDGKAEVGVVRFECHPGLGHKSGDDLF